MHWRSYGLRHRTGAGRNNRDHTGGRGARTTGVILIAEAGLRPAQSSAPATPHERQVRGAGLKDNITGANAFFRLINQLTWLSAILLSLRSVPVLLSVSGCCLWVYHLRCHCHFPQASADDFRQVPLKQGNLVLKNGRTLASSIFLRALSASSGRTPSF